MLVRSEKYPELRVVGVTRFHNGAAEVEDKDALEQLRGLGEYGVVVPESTDEKPKQRRSSKPE